MAQQTYNIPTIDAHESSTFASFWKPGFPQPAPTQEWTACSELSSASLALPLAFAFAFGVPAFDDWGLDVPGCFLSGSGGAWVLI